MVECIWEGCVVVTGLWRGLVVSDGLNGLPQATCVSAVFYMLNVAALLLCYTFRINVF